MITNAIQDDIDSFYFEDAAETFSPLPPPVRVQLLEEGMGLTNGDRDKEYGPPAVNMAASAALKKAMREHMVRDISGAELEALDMALTKIGRLITGTPKRDTYVDAATYLAIAGEIGIGDTQSG